MLRLNRGTKIGLAIVTLVVLVFMYVPMFVIIMNSFNSGKVVQAVTDGKQTYFVEHDRAALSGAKSGLIAKDKDLSIRYAYAGVVVVKDKALERKVPEYQAKGFGGAGRF